MIGGFLAACICLPLAAVAMMPNNHPGVTKVNYARINHGMPLADVERIFGEKGNMRWHSPTHDGQEIANGTWMADDGSRARFLFVRGCVALMRLRDSNETFLEMTRRRLHLP